MIQRFILLAFALLLWSNALCAKPRTESQARLIAEQYTVQRFSRSELAQLRSSDVPLLTLVSSPAMGADMMSARSAKPEAAPMPMATAYYVYNVGSERGYVMVSGDDLLPEVIAYAEEGAFLVDAEQPEHIASFLAEVRATLRYLVEQGRSLVVPRTSQLRPEGVQPLLGDIRWGQAAPFNDLCPVKAEGKSVVGCVATAIAQIMRYHQWPVRGKGVCSYREYDGTQHRVDFSQYTYDWDMMPPMPGEDAPQPVRDALSLLSYHVGVVSRMQYSPNGSGTNSQYPKEGLYKYFKYKGNIELCARKNYQIAQWIDLIAQELNERRPIYYAGASRTVGHAFVCDGYDSRGYFHINFGWNGVADGYFLLYAISPDELGIGGGTSYDGFNDNQEVLIGIEPDRDGSSERTVGERISALSLSVSCQDNQTIQLQDASIELTSAMSYTTRFCLSITPTEEGAKSYYGDFGQEQTLEYHTYYLYAQRHLHEVPSVDLKKLGLPTRNASYIVTLTYEGMNGEKIPVRHCNGGYSEALVSFDASGKATSDIPSLEPRIALTDIIDPNLRGYNESSLTLCVDNLSKEEYFPTFTCYFEDMKGDYTSIASTSTLMKPEEQQQIPLEIAKLRLPAGTKGNIVLRGTYENIIGSLESYELRCKQRIEVLPSTTPIDKLATIKCLARRSFKGAIEYAPDTPVIPFEITNQSSQRRDKLLVEWTLLRGASDGVRAWDKGYKLIEGLEGNGKVQYDVVSSDWSEKIKTGGSFSLHIQLYDVIESGGQLYYGEREGVLYYPVVLVDQLSPAIDEDCYISLERDAGEDFIIPFEADIAVPDMIRFNKITLMGLSKANGVYSIYGVTAPGRTAIVGACTALEFHHKWRTTGIVEADFSHASKDLDRVSLCLSKLKGQAMTDMIQSLPDRSGRTRGTIALIDTSRPELEGNVCTADQVALAARRGWTVTDQEGKAYTAIDAPSERKTDSWTLYPMPADDQLTVVGLPAGSAVTLYTLQGERLYQTVTPASGLLQIDVAQLPSATYLLSTEMGSRRIVVSH